MTIKNWRFVSVALFFIVVIAGILFILQDNPNGPDKNYWYIGIPFAVSLVNLLVAFLVRASWFMRKVVIICLLSLITLACLAGAIVIGGISTMFGGSVWDTGWMYYLWFLIPICLWTSFIAYTVLRKP